MNDETNRGIDGRPMLDFPSMKEKEPAFYTRNEAGEYVEHKPIKEPEVLSVESDQQETEKDEAGRLMLDFDGQPQDSFSHLLDLESPTPEAYKEIFNELAEEHQKKYPGVDFSQELKGTMWMVQQAARPGDLELLNRTGLGNHPMMISAMLKIAKKYESEFLEAWNDSGSMKQAQLNALKIRVQDSISQAIHKIKTTYAQKYGRTL